MFNRDTYTIPFQDKFIIYQPLNKFAFIGNQAIVKLIENIPDHGEVNDPQHEIVLSFLRAHGFFNQVLIETPHNSADKFNPTVAVLCLTTDPNFSCAHWFTDENENNCQELKLETGIQAIDIAYCHAKERHADDFAVSFHGGAEPTLPLRKMQDLAFAAMGKDIPCRLELSSNGSWEEKTTEWIIDHMDNLTLTFEGMREGQYLLGNLPKGDKVPERILKNIRRIDASGLPYNIRIATTNHHADQLAEIIQYLCEQTRCSSFQVESKTETGEVSSDYQTISERKLFIKCFLEAHDIAATYNRRLDYSCSRPWINANSFCTEHNNALVVTPGGIHSSCYEISGVSHPLAKAERKNMCRECFCYWQCSGDCPIKTLRQESLDSTCFSEQCEVNREITKELLLRYLVAGGGIYKEV